MGATYVIWPEKSDIFEYELSDAPGGEDFIPSRSYQHHLSSDCQLVGYNVLYMFFIIYDLVIIPLNGDFFQCNTVLLFNDVFYCISHFVSHN
jgi:hypothetical protein